MFPAPPFLALQGLREHAADPAFHKEWQAVKMTAKLRAAALIKRLTGRKLA